jgi:hypothetical protein
MAKPRQGLVERFKRWLNIDHIVDLSVDLFLILFDVLTSPILIVMRLARYIISNFFSESIKKNIKRAIHWIENKPRWVKFILIPLIIITSIIVLILFYVLGLVGDIIVEVIEEEE